MSESESFVNLNQQQQAAPAHGYEIEPFDAADLLRHEVDATKCKWVEVTIPELKGLLLGHVTTESKSCSSFKPFIEVSPMSLAQEILGGTDNEPSSRIKLQAGLGIFTLVHRESKLHLVHQRRGPVVGTNCGPALHTSLILFCEEGGQENAEDPAEVITELCEKLMADNATTRTNEFTIRRWNSHHGYWEFVARKPARSVDSVVLPSSSKDKIIEDLNKFLTVPTYTFYVEHGIPYKRSYLFYGEPGAGKTSLIQALAGKYKRNLCIMQPTTSKNFNDDSLANAIKSAPRRSIIVLEDVDALFDKNRKCQTKLSITFSGLLNALDGIANPDGQIFIMTTNFRDNLDTALVRNGRVDLHIQFTHATSEQMSSLFTQFYPSAGIDKAEAFSKAVTAALGGRGVNMCALQHYFIDQRENSADEAIANVERIVEDLDEKEMGKKKEEEEKGKEDKEAKKEGDSKAVAAKGKNAGKDKNKAKNKNNAGGSRNKGRSSHRGDVYVFVNSGSAPKGGCKSDSESESSEKEEEEREEEEEEEECSAEGSEAGSETVSDSGSDSE